MFKVPAMQTRAILRGEVDVFVGELGGRPVPRGNLPRWVDQKSLKQHGQHENQKIENQRQDRPTLQPTHQGERLVVQHGDGRILFRLVRQHGHPPQDSLTGQAEARAAPTANSSAEVNRSLPEASVGPASCLLQSACCRSFGAGRGRSSMSHGRRHRGAGERKNLSPAGGVRRGCVGSVSGIGSCCDSQHSAIRNDTSRYRD